MLKERDYHQFTPEGSKGGSEEPHTPVEAPNSLLSVSYAKVLVAVGEGQLAGNPTGRDIYLNGTPILNDAGQPNFGGVTWEWRDGSVDQTYIKGMPETSNEVSVGVDLTQLNPWVRSVTKKSLSSARITVSWPALLQQLANGDTVGYTINYAIDVATDGGPFVEYKTYVVSGKTNSEYERTHSVDLPRNPTSGWSIRVRRLTQDSQSSLIQDTMKIKSFTEVVDMKSRYPNTALLFVQFDSRLFGGGQIPTISVETRGRVIRVPENYNPEQRSYTGIWNGAFKWAYTNNPAWIYMDILTQERFGLGSRVGMEQVDKWSLYELSQYCDVMLDDGTGSGAKAPRHTCNIFIQSETDAWTVLRDLATIFNGMTYWNGSQFTILADKEENTDNIALFSRSSVVDGKFSYQTTDERSIFTSALVSYDDPTNHYGTEVEAVWEKSEILRWGGDRQTTVSAIGCTSRAEAQRRGKYQLLTNMFNTSVTFQTGLQGLGKKVQPGAIIGVADPLLAGKPFTGRLLSGTLTVVTLDRETEASPGDVLFITISDGTQQGRTVKSVTGKVVEVTVAYTETPKGNDVWYLESSSLKSQLFRVTKVSSPSESVYEITGVEYNESKYRAIDNGARLEDRPISVVPSKVQAAPTPVTISSSSYIEQTMALTTMTITWPQTQYAVAYEVQWRVGDADWIPLGQTGANTFDVKGVFTGQYLARVRAINSIGTKSIWTSSMLTNITGKDGAPPALASFTTRSEIFGIGLDWSFKPGSGDVAYVEIQEADTITGGNERALTTIAYPTVKYLKSGLAAGVQFFYRARLVDRTGNIGPYTDWVRGASSANAEEILDYLEGQIGESQLNQNLNDRIDKIEVIEGDVTVIEGDIERIEGDITRIDVDVDAIKVDVSGLHADVDQLNKDVEAVEGSVNWLESQLAGVENQIQNDITQVDKTLNDAIEQTNNDLGDLKDDVADLNNTVSDLQDQVSNFVDALEYDSSKTYKKGDSVREGQKIYQALKDVPVGASPPNPEYWKDVGDIITDLGALSAQVSTNTVSITQQGNTITAQGQQLNALDTRVGVNEAGVAGNTSAIQNLQTTVTQQGNTITSQGQAITALESDVSSLETGQAGNASAIESLRTTVTQQGDTITSQGQAITSLGAEVESLQTDVQGVQSEVEAQGTAITGLTTTVTQQGNTITAHTNSITSLENTVGTLTTDLNGLTTKVDANTTAVSNLTTTVTQQGDTITAQGRDITTLKADLSTVTTDVDGLKTTVSAQGTAINNLETVVTQQGSDISAISSDITKLTADLHLNALDDLYDKAETDQQIGDALNIAEGAASATQSLTAEVTKQGDVINAQGQAITELEASLSGIDVEGVATAVETLKAQVTQQGNTITSQGQSITQLGNSLTLVDTKATDAKTAADKAQGDATTALQQITTKADASAVTALTTRVSNAEGAITSQGQLITNLNNSLTITNQNVTAAKDAADAAQADATDALTKVETKADSSALQALTSRVTNAEGVITSQGESITRLDNSLTITNTNVTAAQQAAQAASDKAGAKGEVIYGTSAPAADKRLPQNLWIDTTNGNNTPKRWNGTEWIAVTDKVATDAAAAAADALAKVELKADSSALQSLTNTVTQQGNTITAQGQAITNLDASLVTTNSNVTAAQNAANAANTLAGGKGKVFFQNAEPPTAERLAQNLWIDTTNGANTPKRWNGTAWVAVTDKVAVDAAQAAQDALTQVALKADATAVQSLTNTVTQQGNDIAANNSAITNLKTTVEFKELDALYDGADTDQQISEAFNIASGAASATQELKSSVERIDDTITAQAESITELQASLEGIDVDSVATAVQNLKVTVEQQGNTISSQGQSITQLNNSLTITDGKATDALGKADNALAQVATKAEASAVTALTTRVSSVEGTVTSQGTLITNLTNSLATTNTNVTAAQQAAQAASDKAGSKGEVIYSNTAPATDKRLPQNLWIDTTGNANTPKRWDGNAWVAVTDKVATDAAAAAASALTQVSTKAEASAVQTLTNRVTSVEGTVTTQGQAITNLNNSITRVEGKADDALQQITTKADASALNSLTTRVTDAEGKITSQGQSITELNNNLVITNGNVTAAQAAAQAASDKAGAKGEVIYGSTAPAVDKRLPQNLWIDTTNGANTPKRWLTNAWVEVTDKVAKDAAAAAADALAKVALKADASVVQALTSTVESQGNAITTNAAAVTKLNTEVQFKELDQLYEDVLGAQVADALNIASGAASANESLTAEVTQQGDLLTAQAIQITDLSSSLSDINGDIVGQGTAIANLKTVTTAQGNTISTMGQDIVSLNNSLTVTDGKATTALTNANSALTQVSTKAEASAVTSLTNRVTAAEGLITTQGQSITQLNNSLTITNTNVTAAQQAANDANTLAGGKGKVIVQNGAPTVADQLAQNLWIDTTGGANTPKRWTGSAWSAVTDKVATDAATAAANALSVANTKADASALTALTTRVTTAEGKITTQGESITSLNNSLVITNGNVTTAQNAANAANTLAGGKGKVIVQTATPAVADQLPQNLWIDMTGGANTPKRWTGSAWAAVTDKVATDAAAAAANALSQVSTKADASAVNSLTTRVTSAEGTITAQGTQLTQLTTRITNAETGVSANAGAISQTNTKVTEIDGKVNATTTRVDGIQAEVNDATAQVQTLSTTVADLDGKASASWGVKLQVNSQGQYVAAGIGLGIENGPAGLQSTFLVSADKFAVVNGVDASLSAPFVVSGGQVFIKDAFIANGSINMLKIGDNLQSTDYVAGVSGWKLSKGGNIEFNGTVAGGGRLTMTNQLIQVFDTNNVLRVRMGIW